MGRCKNIYFRVISIKGLKHEMSMMCTLSSLVRLYDAKDKHENENVDIAMFKC